MYISTKDWKNFINGLSKINKASADAIVKYVQKFGFGNVDDLVSYAYSVVDMYGDASATLAADMYDEIAALEGKFLPPAELADIPDYGEVAKTVYGVLKTSENPNELGGAVSRLVKRTGQDTLLKNGIRDKAEFAWIPSGDTCPFCIALASRGWQRISNKSLRNGHAEHIHSNCDCSYMIRHSKDVDVSGYDPDRYLEMYDSAEGNTPREKINSMRRMRYAERKDVINAQKRAAYAEKKRENSSVNVVNNIRNGIINTKIIDGNVVDPMPEEQYQRMVSGLKKNGIRVVPATEGDDLAFLNLMGAEATYDGGVIIHQGSIPSASAMFEEVIHSTQARIYGEIESTDRLELTAREIEANRMLLKYADAYKFSNTDRDDIKRNLKKWENDFEKLTGEQYDKSGINRGI